MWLETILTFEAAAALWLSALNGALLRGMASQAGSRARRVAIVALALVCVAIGLEALLFLWQDGGDAGWAPALLLERSTLLASVGLLSLLLLRGRARG